MGQAAAVLAAAVLAAAAGAGLPLCSLGSSLSNGRPCAEAGDGRELQGASWELGGKAVSWPYRSGLTVGRRPDERARDPASPDLAGDAVGRRRTKRGFTYPGTLWCGAGDIAESYEQLGEYRETDRCCREHDHCQHLIYPFTYKYGHRNLRWHTISHCDCDRRLRACLRAVNDTTSRVVGQAFFNVIQVPCFEFAFEEQCVEPYFYMWCKNYSTVAVAVLRDPVLYDYGGKLIDVAAARPPLPASSTTAAPRSRSPALSWRPTVGPRPRPRPGSLLPKPPRGKGKERKGWKGERKGKGKGAKQQRQQKGAWAKPPAPGGPLPPRGEDSSLFLKRLSAPGLGKRDPQAPGMSPAEGQEDPFNAILGDDPSGGRTKPGAGRQPEGTQPGPLEAAAPEPPGRGRQRKGKRRKGRRRLRKGGRSPSNISHTQQTPLGSQPKREAK